VTTKTAWVFAAVVSTAAALVAADTPRDVFGVGILRRDGVLIPFATFDGRRWRNTWPAPARELTVPVNLDSVPKGWWGPTGPLETWHAWVEWTSHPVRVTQPDWVDVHCARHLALKTDYRADGVLPSEKEQPYPKEGLATSPLQRVERIEIVSPAAQERRALAPVLLEAFNRAERDTASHGSGHPIARRSREHVDPAIEALYAFGESPRIYYVEATRAYRSLGQQPDECLAVAFGTGWFVREGSAVRSLVTAVDLLDCDRLGASYMLPLGVIRAAGRLFWLAQFSGWEHERYAVLEITPKKIEVMVSTWGGGC
jgi:hypothetical protein